jgi:hypothetical protein
VHEEHPHFRPPDDPEIPIWRYMDFTKFVWTLDNRALFFSRADLLGDRFEGSYSAANLALRAEVYGKDAELVSKVGAQFYAALPRYTVVNCWHMNKGESAAMWRLYLRSGEGVAIRSTYQRLVHSLVDFEPPVYAGIVNYSDYEHDWIPEGSTFAPYMHKRQSFEHERELRAIRQDFVSNGEEIDLTQERFPDGGEVVPVRLDTLIERVYVAPGLPSWMFELVQSIAARFDVDAQVAQSALDAEPLF